MLLWLLRLCAKRLTHLASVRFKICWPGFNFKKVFLLKKKKKKKSLFLKFLMTPSRATGQLFKLVLAFCIYCNIWYAGAIQRSEKKKAGERRIEVLGLAITNSRLYCAVSSEILSHTQGYLSKLIICCYVEMHFTTAQAKLMYLLFIWY